jgi:hypothetical protein
MTTFVRSHPIAPRALDVDRLSTVGRVSAAAVFAGMGLLLVALAMALPLSLGVIEREGIAVAAADLALAERLSGVAWAVAAAGALNFAAALIVLDRSRLAKRAALVVAGAGLLLALAAQVAGLASGTSVAAGVASALAAVYGIAVIGIVLGRPTSDRR